MGRVEPGGAGCSRALERQQLVGSQPRQTWRRGGEDLHSGFLHQQTREKGGDERSFLSAHTPTNHTSRREPRSCQDAPFPCFALLCFAFRVETLLQKGFRKEVMVLEEERNIWDSFSSHFFSFSLILVLVMML